MKERTNTLAADLEPGSLERGEGTTVTTTVLYASKAIRDAILKSNMERGVAESYDKLAEMLAGEPARTVK